MLTPLHDLFWSLQQGKLHELFLKDSMTLATWGLVLVTFLLVLDSSVRGREQRKRWDREDELRNKDRDEQRERWKRDDEQRRSRDEYKYRMWITMEDSSVAISVANLGYTSFLAQTIFLDRKDPDGTIYPPCVLSWRRVVAPSSIETFRLERELFTAPTEVATQYASYFKCEVSLTLDGVSGRIPTNFMDFDVIHDEGHLELIQSTSF